jgi:4-hydroxybenzoate polyprenyltransferase
VTHLQTTTDTGVYYWLRNEASVTYSFVYRDLSASLIPGVLATVSALVADRGTHTPISIAIALSKAALYFALYIYVFCLPNQLRGIEEDRLNKPDRPLPSGRLSPSQVMVRWRIAMLIFPITALLLGGWQLSIWSILWQSILMAYNYGGLDKHWVTKNIVFIGAGTFALLGAAWQIGASHNAENLSWIVTISLLFGTTLHLQDFRDIAGDRRAERRTLPIAIGVGRARIITAASLCTIPIVMLLQARPRERYGITLCAALALFNLLSAYRLLTKRTPEDDHTTYMIHTYWFCAAVGSVGIFIRLGHP